jgi:penicillin-binding protein 2
MIGRHKPHQGGYIQTTLHTALQCKVVEIMSEVRRGCAIVLDIRTGDILAIVSVPTFDPNIFIKRLSTQDWQELSQHPDMPLVNRALSGLYAPGSTFKMVVALAALRADVITRSTTFFCPGHYDISGRRFHCWRWRLGGHGVMDVLEGLGQSCDVFFYSVAERLGAARIMEAARDLGLGTKTSVNMPAEKSAPLPSLLRGSLWLGQALNLSIGQGQLLLTPLQMVVLAASIASGKAVSPRLISSSKKVDFPPLAFSTEHLDIVREGMKMVVHSSRGTARGINNKQVDIAGKTGSTQVAAITIEERRQRKINERPYHLRDHALFIGYAPASAPKFAVVVVVEHGESGGRVAAPVAKEILLAANNLVKDEL